MGRRHKPKPYPRIIFDSSQVGQGSSAWYYLYLIPFAGATNIQCFHFQSQIVEGRVVVVAGSKGLTSAGEEYWDHLLATIPCTSYKEIPNTDVDGLY